MALSDYSITAGSNTTIGGVSIAEGCPPSNVNDVIRALAADIAVALGNYPGHGFKNKLLNGDMSIWQRGAGGSASISVAASATAYSADRWYITTGANQAHVISQQAGLTDQSRWCARVKRTAAQTGTGAMVFGQPLTLDTLTAIRGKKVTISAQVRSGANWSPASGNLTMALYVGTGAEAKRGAGFTSETTVATVTTALSTSSAVTPISAASAAVVPTSATQAELQFTWTPVGTAGANDYVEIDEVQLELGSVASPFERLMFADELARCLRFYQKTFPYQSAPVQGINDLSGSLVYFFPTGASGTAVYDWRPPVELRKAAPTYTTFNPITGSSADWRDVTNSTERTASTATNSSKSVSVSLAAGAANSNNHIHMTVEGEI